MICWLLYSTWLFFTSSEQIKNKTILRRWNLNGFHPNELAADKAVKRKLKRVKLTHNNPSNFSASFLKYAKLIEHKFGHKTRQCHLNLQPQSMMLLKTIVLASIFHVLLSSKVYFSDVITTHDPQYCVLSSKISSDKLTFNGTATNFVDLSKMMVSK